MKNILIFNDISGLGNCSLGVNLPIFSKLGHNCMPIVTATFSRQTGFEKYIFLRNEKLVESCLEIVQTCRPDAVYTGFCVDCKTICEVKNCVQNIQNSFVFVDPILGDNGKLYDIFNFEYVQEMKKLVALADCISPNLTEACLLADVDFTSLLQRRNEPSFLAICGEVFGKFLTITGAKNAVITGVPCGNILGNIVLQKGQSVRFVTNEKAGVNFSGTGDAFGSVLLGELLNGADLLQATQVAANFVAKAAAATECSDRRFGIEFCKVIDIL